MAERILWVPIIGGRIARLLASRLVNGPVPSETELHLSSGVCRSLNSLSCSRRLTDHQLHIPSKQDKDIIPSKSSFTSARENRSKYSSDRMVRKAGVNQQYWGHVDELCILALLVPSSPVSCLPLAWCLGNCPRTLEPFHSSPANDGNMEWL